MTPSRRLACLAAAAAALAPQPAAAHLVGMEFGDFYAGVLHLAVAPEPLAALLAIGLYAALQPRERARWMLLGLPAGLAAGAALPWIVGSLDILDPAIASTLAVTGLAGVAALRLPAAALGVLAAFVGLVHGYANGVSAIGTPADPWLYSFGVISAGTVIGTLGVAALSAVIGAASWVPLAARVLSSWVAAVGTILIGLAAAGA